MALFGGRTAQSGGTFAGTGTNLAARENGPMPRRKPRPAGRPVRRVRETQSYESGPDGEWNVRRLSGSPSGRSYRCPGCAQELPASRPHVVAWPADSDGADRRHWHTACWEARTRRRPLG